MTALPVFFSFFELLELEDEDDDNEEDELISLTLSLIFSGSLLEGVVFFSFLLLVFFSFLREPSPSLNFPIYL